MTQRTDADLHHEIAACTLCAGHLPQSPRPVVQFSPRSRIIIIGQAPGSKAHETGVPFDDDSGDRLRGWLGIDKSTFYDTDNFAIVPMGFCYPGKGNGGDAPPRRECAPAWHERVLHQLPNERLSLLVGSHAQAQYLPETRRMTLTERVHKGCGMCPVIPLPHPSWRVQIWMTRNPWFERETLPRLRQAVARQVLSFNPQR